MRRGDAMRVLVLSPHAARLAAPLRLTGDEVIPCKEAITLDMGRRFRGLPAEHAVPLRQAGLGS
jgi:hypothetical protein